MAMWYIAVGMHDYRCTSVGIHDYMLDIAVDIHDYVAYCCGDA